MNSLELRKYLHNKNEKNIFKGVYSSNNLPNSFSVPAAFIVNLSPTYSPGTHWVVIYIEKNHNIDYFDSFGIPPRETSILSFLKRHGKTIFYTNQQIQHILSRNCGKFSAVFVMFKILNKPTEYFLRLFTRNLILNDLLIENYFMYFLN
jgi:hypothetical protein